MDKLRETGKRVVMTSITLVYTDVSSHKLKLPPSFCLLSPASDLFVTLAYMTINLPTYISCHSPSDRKFCHTHKYECVQMSQCACLTEDGVLLKGSK